MSAALERQRSLRPNYVPNPSVTSTTPSSPTAPSSCLRQKSAPPPHPNLYLPCPSYEPFVELEDTLASLQVKQEQAETQSEEPEQLQQPESENRPSEEDAPGLTEVRSTTEPAFSGSKLQDLPEEIQEFILDHLFGIKGSTASTSTPGKSSAVRGWSSILRHPRRKVLTDLALVSRLWRPLVQERLYRHSTLTFTFPFDDFMG